ncbi:MAG: capsule assembly Wzi family protein [Bacteroides sp.]|nr:capsule assembly Wzi family protein [Bacteroides sp.]
MKVSKVKKYIVSLLVFVVANEVSADEPLHYDISLTGGVGSNTFAPYYISSLRHGRFTQADNLQAEVSTWKDMDLTKRFSYGFGVDIVGGLASSTTYERYDVKKDGWISHQERPSAVWLQQLYGQLKFRGVFMQLGLKEQKSAFLNQELTSGDLVESGNTRPMPQIRAGFLDFQDIPLTNGWLQISGEGAFGFMLDDGWWKNHYNYYSRHITTHQLYNYKRAYFRTKPSERFSVLFGLQAAATFGGTTTWYTQGVVTKRMKHPSSLRYFLKMLFPMEDGGEGFYSGNHLGSWDLRMRYRLRNGDKVSLYSSWLWDDGSGIGKLNGFDGLWGAEYKSARDSYVNGVVVEYFDFTNQSGPIHFNPSDYPGCTLPGHVSGADDYYNNASYNAYSYFGMALGTPVMMSPLYNRDGYAYFAANAVRGFHVGVAGSLSPTVNYRVKGGYRKAWGTPFVMLKDPLHLSSIMLEAEWRSPKIKGLRLDGRFEVDSGNMPCNAVGVMVSVKYEGLMNL